MMQKARACRLGVPCTPRTFKQLLACRTQHHPTLTVERIAEIACVRRDRLYAFSNDNDPSEIPFKALLKICAAIGDRDLLDFELEPYGWRTLETNHTSASDLLTEAMDVSVAHGTLMEAIRNASRDGRLDDIERQAIRQQLRSLRREMEDIDSVLDNAKARTT